MVAACGRTGASMFAFATSERFARLERRDRDRLEALSKLDEFDPGQEILVAGHPSGCIYLIASGGVDVRVKTRSGDVTLAHLGPGDLFGELGLPPGAAGRAGSVRIHGVRGREAPLG